MKKKSKVKTKNKKATKATGKIVALTSAEVSAIIFNSNPAAASVIH